MRQELVFQETFSTLALTMFEQIHAREGGKELVFVGIHARRGDRIHVWKQRLVRRLNKLNNVRYCTESFFLDVQRFYSWSLRREIL